MLRRDAMVFSNTLRGLTTNEPFCCYNQSDSSFCEGPLRSSFHCRRTPPALQILTRMLWKHRIDWGWSSCSNSAGTYKGPYLRNTRLFLCATNCCIERTKTWIHSSRLSNDALGKKKDSRFRRVFVFWMVSSRMFFRKGSEWPIIEILGSSHT